jgi:hypothetical protein
MDYPLKKLSTGLFVLLFLMPVLSTLPGQSDPEKQFIGLQIIWMGVCNLPFVLVAIISLIMGNSFYKNSPNKKASSICIAISIGASISGSLLMLAWGLGVF